MVKRLLRCIAYRVNAMVVWNFHKTQSLIQMWLYGDGGEISRTSRFQVPVRIDGAGLVEIGERVQLGYYKAPMLGCGEILLQARTIESEIFIGEGTWTSNNISIISCKKISIGRKCQIGDQVSIYDCDFHEIDPATRNRSSGEILPVQIGDNVWLGSRVLVLKGVTIGDGSVIAAGSVVAKSIPARSLAGGVPARVIRRV